MYSAKNYIKLNVMGRGVFKNQMSWGGEVGKNFRPIPPPPMVILNGMVLSFLHICIQLNIASLQYLSYVVLLVMANYVLNV